MKIMRLLVDGEPTWAIAEGDNAYRAEGDIFAGPRKGAALGALQGLKVLAPVDPQNKVIVLLSNWGDDREGRAGPGFVIKPPNGRINPGETIVYPELAAEVWIETELGIVVGQKCRRVTPEQARERILGYTVSNDVTAAKWKRSCGVAFDVYTGKGFDTFCIVGPCIDTTVDPTNTTLRGYIDNEQFFEKHSSHMLWDAYEVVSWLSQVMTLDPGDVISCGACPETLVRHMQPGQLVGVAIDGIGRFDNPVISESEAIRG
jgi:2-keto-4-pentenoate hydratase/2-oxohepta-3-ene-1,7-dioic acid hydratase in catechol pathway